MADMSLTCGASHGSSVTLVVLWLVFGLFSGCAFLHTTFLEIKRFVLVMEEIQEYSLNFIRSSSPMIPDNLAINVDI